MSMRISSNQMYTNGIDGILKLQSDLYTTQNQIDTGRRIVTPKDDPVGAAQALMVSQSLSVNDLYIKNQGTATDKLNNLDSTLSSVNDQLQSIYSSAVAAGNGAYSDADRAAIATQLKAGLANLVALGNSQDGTGRYIFAGFKSTTPPFAVTANTTPFSLANPYVAYSGDDGVQTLQVDASTNLPTSEPGSQVFMRIQDASGNVTGRSVFDAVQNMINYLNTPGGTASSATYTTALKDISDSISSISRERSAVGASLNSLTNMGTVAADRKLQYQTQLSSLQDVDMAQALSSVSKQQLQLQASQATFAAVSKLSLFNYI